MRPVQLPSRSKLSLRSVRAKLRAAGVLVDRVESNWTEYRVYYAPAKFAALGAKRGSTAYYVDELRMALSIGRRMGLLG